MFSDVVRKAADTIRGTNRPATVPGFLRPIDTARIARDIKLEAVARDRGNRELPPTQSESPDSTERDIIQRIESEWAWQGGELINNLRAYAQRLIGYSIQSEFAKLEIQARDTLARLRAADHRAEAELGPLREQYVGFRDALLDFKKKHRLKRIARTPPGRWTTFGLLGILVAIESVLNGFFFMKGSEFGLVGGVGIAIAISSFNVVFCFLLGLWPARAINLRNIAFKFLAFVVTATGLCGVIALHGFAAHYRDAVGQFGEEGGLVEALVAIKAAPWQLADVNSYYLFGLGLLFSLGAFYKGCTFDDPYPFYGAKARTANEARDDYSNEHAELFDALEDIKDATVSALEDGITRIPLFPQQAANVRAQRAALVETFRGYEASVVTAGNQLLFKYRDENRLSRKTPVPRYFDHQWSLPHSFLESADVKTLTAGDTDRPTNVDVTLDELRRLSKEVIAEYEKLLIVYPHPTKMAATDVS